MQQKNLVRKKYYALRKKKYYEINKFFFVDFINLIKKKFKDKKINLSLYYPSSFELNVLKLLDIKHISKQNILLPVIENNNSMNFFPWKKNDVLLINKYGMLEPDKSEINIPDVILVPLLVFDENKYRLGYGKGFYDRYLNKNLKKFKKILTVGVAFSFQKYHKLPINNKDVKLDYILTEKGIY
jgi:5-formyltetrahydrofolate cyclo-ligase